MFVFTLLQCYWFYRPKEVPDEAWDMPDQPRRKDIRGAQYAWSKRSKPQVERKSERQVCSHGLAPVTRCIVVKAQGACTSLTTIIGVTGQVRDAAEACVADAGQQIQCVL